MAKNKKKGTTKPPRVKRGANGKRPKKNKIHMSLFVDGEEVTLIDEFNAAGEAIAAAREFLDKHGPKAS